MVFGSSPGGAFGRDDRDEDFFFLQGTSLSGQFAQQREVRMIAQKAALEEVANSELRRLLARNMSFNCTDVPDTPTFYKTANRLSTPRWRAPATIPDIDDAETTAKFQGQSPESARYSVRKGMEGGDVSEADWNPAPGTMCPWNGSPFEDSEIDQEFAGIARRATGDQDVPSSGPPQDGFGVHARGSSSDSPRLIPAPNSPAVPSLIDTTFHPL